jgi:hypothetical protein
MKPIPTAAAREASVFALFAILAIAMTWPLAAHLGTAVPDPGDAYVSTYVMAWDYHATFSRAPLSSLPIFHPAKDALAFSEHLYGTALPFFPLYAMGVAPLTVYNVALLLAFAFSGYGAWVLARVAGASWIAAIAAGCFFAFVPYRFTQLAHISYVSAGWLALLFAAALAYLQSPTYTRAALLSTVPRKKVSGDCERRPVRCEAPRRGDAGTSSRSGNDADGGSPPQDSDTFFRGAVLSLAFFFNGLSCLHWLILGATTLAFSIPIALIVTPASRRLRFWIPPLIATALATVALLPFLLPYREARELYQMERSLADLEPYSAHLRDWLVGPLHLPYGAYVNNGMVDPERWLFPGLVPLLIVIALWRRRPFAIPFLALTYFRAVHVLPPRWDFATRAIDLSGSPWVPALVAIVLLLVPLPPGEGGAKRRVRGVPFALAWLLLGFVCSLGVHSPLYRALFHVSPFRGIRVPARWSMIVYLALAVLIAAALSRRHAMVAVLCTLAILAEQRAPIRYYYTVAEAPEVYRWLKTAPIEGAVFELPYRRDGSEYRYMLRAATHLRPMINGISSFEPRNVSDLETLDASLLTKLRARGASHIIVHTDRVDASQWLAENAASLKLVRRFCSEEVYAIDRNAAPAIESCDAPVAHLDSPPPNADIRGPLTIRGTINQSDVQVFALFDGSRLSVPVPIDGNTFRWTLSLPPRWLHKYTDLQIEIVDRAGKRTRLDDQFLEWRQPDDLLFYDWRPGALHELAQRMHRDDRFAYAIRDSTGQANVIARALLRDTKDLDDRTFEREADRALLGHERPVRSWPLHPNRYAYITSLISSDEFAAKHLLPTPR